VVHYAEVELRCAEVVHSVEVVHYAGVVHSAEVELRCAGVVLHCVVVVQRELVVDYAGVSQTLVSALHCVVRVGPVQLVHDSAWAFQQFLHCRAFQHVSVALYHLPCSLAV
jgi:hypothetical protein